MDLFEQELAEVSRMRVSATCYGGICACQEVREIVSETGDAPGSCREAQSLTSQSILAAKAQGALQKLVGRAITLRLSDWSS